MKLPTTWTTKDKRAIPIKEMTDSHLLNAIRFYRERAPAMQENQAFAAAGEAAGFDSDSMASYYAEGMVDDLMHEATEDWLERQPLWKALKREAKSRKLTVVP